MYFVFYQILILIVYVVVLNEALVTSILTYYHTDLWEDSKFRKENHYQVWEITNSKK